MKHSLKIAYIFLAGIGVFFVNNIYVLLAIIAVHLLLFFLIKDPKKNFRFLYKVRWFVLLIILFDAFSGPNDIPLFQIKKWVFAISYSGLLSGAVMSCKLISMLFVTQVVRMTMKGEEFVKGLTGLGLGASVAQTIDEIMVIMAAERKEQAYETGKGGGKGDGSGKGGGSGQGKRNAEKSASEDDKGEVTSKDVLFRGKVGNIPQRLLQRITYARRQVSDNPNVVIASSALAVTLIRLVKIAPGIPIASGHKNILLFPVMIYGIDRSHKRFAGTQIGFISGILHFTMGFGKYGPLSIPEFMILGVIFDLFLKLPVNTKSLWFLMLIGAVGGVVRSSTEILVALILGLPEGFYYAFLPYVSSQLAFGIASGFISKSIINTKDQHESVI